MSTSTFFVGPDDDPDKYRLRRQMGGGGEAELWEADMAFAGDREPVAVKILRSEHSADYLKWRDRWAEQVELLRVIRHPGVVGVHCHFEGPLMHLSGQADPGSRALYLVMNWVSGQDLRDWVLAHLRPEDRLEGMRYLAQIADILDWLHSGRATPSGRPVVHGDLSPANVVVNGDGQAVLVDFGLFRMVRHITAVAAGTPGYSAPEVLRRGEYSPASDRYAFGGLAYYVLTGTHPPVEKRELFDGLRQVARSFPQYGVTLEVLTSMFSHEPAQRPPCGEWVRGLRLQSTTAPVLTGALPPEAPVKPTLPALWSALRGRRPLPRRVTVAVAAVVSVVIALAIGIPLASTASRLNDTPSPAAESSKTNTAGADRPRTAGSSSPSASPAPLATPSLSPSAGPAAAVRTVMLVDIQPETSVLLQGEWRIAGTAYKQSVGCRDCFLGQSATYSVAGQYRRFKGTLATEYTYEAEMTVTLNRQTKVMRVATLGRPIEFDIDVTGVNEIRIELETGNCCELVVIGQARFEAW